jgi:DNA-binding transcriptional LysR family regulator
MDLTLLETFVTVVEEGSFSRAGRKLLRTQPAVSLALQRLENELGDKLIDRSSKSLVLTEAGKLVYAYAQRFDGLSEELVNALAELRDKRAGKLTIGANESTALYLLNHLADFRQHYPGVKVEIRRSLSSRIPEAVLLGSIELGATSYDPADPLLDSMEIYTDALTFVVSPQHRFAGRSQISIRELGMETFIAHNVVSPYRAKVIETFRSLQVPLNMGIEMPTIETIRGMVRKNLGVAFLPKMCVEQDLSVGILVEVPVEEIHMDRKIRLIYPARRQLSHAAQAFLELVARPQ